MTTAVDKWPACARLLTVAPAGHLPTAPTPLPGTRPPPLGYRRRLSGFLHEKFSCWASLAHLFELGRPNCPLLAFRLRQFLTMEWVTAHPIRPGRAPVHAAALGQPAGRTS